METHAPHLNHSPGKTFRHYFFEFFMLFLAVFCGFLAENFREHQVEHQLEKQYMVSLVEDLKADTAEFSRLSVLCNNISTRLDSVITFMRPPVAKDKIRQYYIEMIWINSMRSFSYSDRTTEQLKNSGAYRLIRKNNVADSIVAYDNKMRGVFSKNYNVMWDHRIKLISMFEEIVDLSPLSHTVVDSGNKRIFFDDSLSSDKLSRLQLVTNDNEKLMAVYNASVDQIFFSVDFSNWIKRMNAKAVSLIQLIKEEYHVG